jgi:hypothetical protein
MDEPPRETLRFGWAQAHERLAAWATAWPFGPASAGGRFAGHDPATGGRLELEVPLVLGWPPEGMALKAWCATMARRPGRHVVLLVQAGAVALGLWEDDVLLAHKVFKRYVVRGRGRAQPTHLKTKGRSRMGSRLRLRNAEALREDLGGRLAAWWVEHGAPARIFVSCPKREWPELFRACPDLPFGQRDPRLVRIPLDVHVPGFEEVQRVRGFLGRGRLRRWGPEASAEPSPVG